MYPVSRFCRSSQLSCPGREPANVLLHADCRLSITIRCLSVFPPGIWKMYRKFPREDQQYLCSGSIRCRPCAAPLAASCRFRGCCGIAPSRDAPDGRAALNFHGCRLPERSRCQSGLIATGKRRSRLLIPDPFREHRDGVAVSTRNSARRIPCRSLSIPLAGSAPG